MVLENYIANDYLRAFIIFVALLFALRIVVSILERIVLRIVKKTKTELDDVIIQKSSTPITLILFFVSLKFALEEIAISGSLLGSLNSIVYSGMAIFVGYLLYVVVDIVVFEAWKTVAKKAKIGSDDSLASLVHGVLKIILVVLVFVYILDLWGVEITPLLAGLGIAGLAVALALQPTLSNIFSGVAMVMDKSVRRGDLVYLDANTKGKIEKIGLRSTKIKTFDNEMIIIPNSKLADSNIQNVALPEPKTRVVVPFSVGYGSDINKVKKVVMKEILSIEKLCDEPSPQVRFIVMGNSSLDFKAYFYVESFEDRFNAIDEANTKIYNALNKNKILIPFPQMDVHLKK